MLEEEDDLDLSLPPEEEYVPPRLADVRRNLHLDPDVVDIVLGQGSTALQVPPEQRIASCTGAPPTYPAGFSPERGLELTRLSMQRRKEDEERLKEDFLAALSATGGLMSFAVKKCRTSLMQIRRLRTSDSDFDRAIDDVQESVNDLVEAKVIKRATKDEDMRAARLYLEAHAKHRGYGRAQASADQVALPAGRALDDIKHDLPPEELQSAMKRLSLAYEPRESSPAGADRARRVPPPTSRAGGGVFARARIRDTSSEPSGSGED